MNAPMRIFAAKPATRGEEPLLIGLVGPPGGGKTLSALRLARGIQSVRGGDIVLIDTESGRSRKYCGQIPFHHVEFAPPFTSPDFLAAIQQQLGRNPACIIVDSMSDEHEGEGGYLEFHDAEVGRVRGNEWAAWAKPKAARKRLITGLLQIKVPLIFTFRAREKTQQVDRKVINIGWQPVAPLEIIHALDLTCILPPKADGVPVWRSDKIGEDFVIKLPNFLQPFIKEGQPLSEEMGSAFASWALGNSGATNPALEGPEPVVGDTHRPHVGDSGDGSAGSGPAKTFEEHDADLAAAASQGMEALRTAWNDLPKDVKATLKAAVERRHKPTAQAADAGRAR